MSPSLLTAEQSAPCSKRYTGAAIQKVKAADIYYNYALQNVLHFIKRDLILFTHYCAMIIITVNSHSNNKVHIRVVINI